jgi:hypothetical protein
MVDRSLVGPVFERNPTPSSVSTPKLANLVKSGFPVAQHRSKSAFARGRDLQKRGFIAKSSETPAVISTRESGVGADASDELQAHDWRRQISEENDQKVKSMSEEERVQATEEIFEQFGSGVGELFEKIAQARKRKAADTQSAGDIEQGRSAKVPGEDPSQLSSRLAKTTNYPHFSPQDLLPLLYQQVALAPPVELIGSFVLQTLPQTMYMSMNLHRHHHEERCSRYPLLIPPTVPRSRSVS